MQRARSHIRSRAITYTADVRITVRILAVLLLTAMVAGCGGTRGEAPKVERRGETSPPVNPQEEVPWQEAALTLPPYPRERDLIEFELNGQTSNRFYIDGPSLSVVDNKAVRFVLVIRSADAAVTTSYSSVRCDTREWKDYAFGNNGAWELNPAAQWRPIRARGINDYQETLRTDFLCTEGLFTGGAKGSAKEIVRTLKNPSQPDPRVPQRRL